MAESLLLQSKNPDVVLLGIPYDKTSSFRKGADKGPEAIINCLGSQIEIYERFTKWCPAKHLKINSKIMEGIGNLKPELMVKEVSSEIKKSIDKNTFIISLGGEHSVSLGAFDAWSKTNLKDSITILQIDAHFDLRNDDSDYHKEPSKYAHSCVMRRALDMGFKILPVGIRAYADFELRTALANKVDFFEWPRAESNKLIKEIISKIKAKNVYISIDADGIDPAHMPATGTAVQGGLSWNFLFNILKEIFNKKNVIGADIVEVAPKSDDYLTEYGAAQICYYIIALKFKNNFYK